MLLRREFQTRPRLVLEVQEETKFVLFYYSLKYSTLKLASLVGSYVRRPSEETVQRAKAVQRFMEMTPEDAIAQCKSLGIIEENAKIEIL